MTSTSAATESGSKTPEQQRAWRDGYLYGKRDGSEGRPQAVRGDAEAYGLGYRWGQRHPRSAFRMPPTYPPGEFQDRYDTFDERDCGGVYDGCGHVYSDADPGL